MAQTKIRYRSYSMTYFTLYVTLPTVTFPLVFVVSSVPPTSTRGQCDTKSAKLLPEVAVLVGVGEQVIENVVDGDGPVEVERDATDRHHDLRPGR